MIDMTWVWAGPYAAMLLAHLGAEVIKIESSNRIDVTRRLAPFADEVVGLDRSGYFNLYNQGKQSVLVDVKHPRGLGLLRELIGSADVIIDNMRAGALARMGLSYEELRSLNPSIVAVSMTGFGEDGPERDRMAYGSIIDALSGVASSNGLVGGGPTDFAMSLPDPCAGVHTAIATVATLLRARTTGEGDRVETAMLEASVAAFPWPVLYEAVGAGPTLPMGNRDDEMSPHGVFRAPRGLRVGRHRRRDRPAVRAPRRGDGPTRAGPQPAVRHAGGPPGQRGRARGRHRRLDGRARGRRRGGAAPSEWGAR